MPNAKVGGSGVDRRGVFSLNGPWVAIDLETTGLDPEQDAIIELGAVLFRDSVAVARFSSLVNPGCPLPRRVAALTGLTDAQLEGALSISAVLPGFLAFIDGYPMVGHNLRFDLAFLLRAWEASRSPAPLPANLAASALHIDTLELARILMPRESSHALAALHEAGYEEPTDLEPNDEAEEAGDSSVSTDAHRATAAHRAAADALAAGELLCRLWNEGLRLPSRILGAASFWLGPAADQLPGLASFIDGLREERALAPEPNEGPPGGRRAAGMRAGQQEPGAGATGKAGLSPDALLAALPAAFGPAGLLSRVIPGYEVRPEQQAMCDAVADVMRDGGRLVVEAGTGVGKSLAYLLPAVAIAENAEERVVVSTHTVTLQDQLVERELPLLERTLGRTIRHAVLKGRANYLCRRKWDDFFAGSLVADESERLFGLRILIWSVGTTTGDVTELNLSGPESSLWHSIAGDEHCWGMACPHHHDCFIQAARAAAGRADLVVANHALVCSDVLAGNSILPPYQHLVVDEAHHLEGVATDHFGLSASEEALVALIGGALPSRGRAARLFGSATSSGPGQVAGAAWPMPGDIADAGRLAADAMGTVRALFAGLRARVGTGRGTGGEPGALEMRYGHGHSALPPATQDAAAAVAAALRALAAKLNTIAERAPAGTTAAMEITASSRELAAHSAAVQALGAAETPGWVYWLRGGESISLHGAPITVAGDLARGLWSRVQSAVLVSATLAIAGSFQHTIERTGLASGEGGAADGPATLLLASPFDFRSQALLCVPRDLPTPGGAEADAQYSGAVAAFLADLLPAVGGRSLVLFTSHRMLRQVHELSLGELLDRGLNVLAQGVDGGRSRLLRALRQEENVVVFGTSTFWEGIDVKGPQLSCLVIARLPFPRPDEPLTAARIEALETDGRSSFAELTLPHAVLRLKQGFGRLIRAADDRGAVVILDGRITRRAYGRVFLESLPPATVYHGSSRSVINRATSWINGQARTTGVSWTAPGPHHER